MKRRSRAFLVALAGLQGCATMSVNMRIEEVGCKHPGHLAWWDDSVPRVLELPRLCDGPRPEFLVPGPQPRVALRLDYAAGVALFHDDSLGCAEGGTRGGSPLRLVVARTAVPRGPEDSALFLGRLAPDSVGMALRGDVDPNRVREWWSLGKDEGDGKYNENACPRDGWCAHDGAVVAMRSEGRVRSLEVRERLHPEDSPRARRRKAGLKLGYLWSVPVDVVLSPAYLVGYGLLAWALRDYNPWH